MAAGHPAMIVNYINHWNAFVVETGAIDPSAVMGDREALADMIFVALDEWRWPLLQAHIAEERARQVVTFRMKSARWFMICRLLGRNQGCH